MSNNTLLFVLYRMGYRARMTAHGFRGVDSTILHEQGWPHAHIELQLPHQDRNAVSASYNHALYLKPRAEMMQAWAAHLDLLRKDMEANSESLAEDAAAAERIAVAPRGVVLACLHPRATRIRMATPDRQA
jgi:hypothetical protein